MAIPIVGYGYQTDDGNLNEVDLINTPAPIAFATGNQTITAAQLLNTVILGSPGASAAAYTLPTVAALETALGDGPPKVGFTFDVYIVNVNGTVAGLITVTTNTGWTLTGLAVVQLAAAAGSSCKWRARKASAGAWTFQRISG